MSTEPVVGRTVTTRSRVGSLLGFGVAAVVVAAIVVGVAYRGSTEAAASTNQAISAVVTHGIDSLYSATIVGPKNGKASSVSVSEMHAKQDGLRDAFARWFTGEPLDLYSSRIKAAMGEEIDGGHRDVDGGANVTVTSIDVDGNAATATATAYIWLQTATVTDVVDSKTDGTWNYDLHLVNTQGAWRIDKLTFTPAAGTVTP